MKILQRDFTGFRGEKFTVLGWASRPTFLQCQCDCGKIFEVKVYPVLAGTRKSCGMSCGSTKHGKLNTKVYRAWQSMKSRCYSSSNPAFKDYGARGITVCERWRTSFDSFYADMGDPSPGMTLERKDVNKGYNPENCKWATVLEQNRNQQRHALLEVDGVTKAVWEWALITEQPASTIYSRIRKGWMGREALCGRTQPRPPRPSLAASRHKHAVVALMQDGLRRTWSELVDITGIDRESIRRALRALEAEGYLAVTHEKQKRGGPKAYYQKRSPK